MTELTIDTLPNGLTVIIEKLDHLRSVAYDLSLPGGLLLDEDGAVGGGSITQELVTRGAGGCTAFELSNRFDEAGIAHGESCGFDRIAFSGACIPESLLKGLGVVADMVLRPTVADTSLSDSDFAEDELANIKAVMFQDIASITDSPTRHASLSFDQVYLPRPYNRPACGRSSDIRNFGIEDARRLWSRYYRPNGACLSIAGNVDRDDILRNVTQIFANWEGKGGALPSAQPLNVGGNYFVRSPSEQVQILIAYPSAHFLAEHYYAARVTNVILSGGMFGRLFIEVREKRGLCYSVNSTHIGRGDLGYVRAYAGTTTERAQETLQVMRNELVAVRGTVTDDELERAKANLKASLIMNLESPSSRASANLSEWWLTGRVRRIEEIESAVDEVTKESIDNYISAFPPANETVLTLGSEAIVANATEVELKV